MCLRHLEDMSLRYDMFIRVLDGIQTTQHVTGMNRYD